MIPIKNTILIKHPLLFSKKMKDAVSYFEWNLLHELVVQANVNADVLINKADLVEGKVPIEQLPIEQLDDLIGSNQIHIGATAPEDEHIILWLKLE